MSFFSKLFTRNITFLEAVNRDASYPDILHVFGAIRVMPDEGDSFDIYRHSVIDLNTYAVTNGLQQRGNDFSIKSPYAQRAVAAMSEQLNRKLALKTKKEEEDDDDDYESESEPDHNLEKDCEYSVVDLDSGDSDTAEPKRLPKNCLAFTKNKIGDRERFTVQLHKSGVGMQTHQLSGMHDYFRHVLLLKETNRLLCTYRKESAIGSGGMAFFVLDLHTGAMLHNDMIK